MLVAKKVLDEGVNIPETRRAIMLASSTVQREWVQRRGRILRMADGKEKAVVHDILAFPPADFPHDKYSLRLIQNEFDRARAFGVHAMNSGDVSMQLLELGERYSPRR